MKGFIVLGNHGRTVRFDKCKFGVNELDYLEHKISPHGIAPKFSVVRALKEAKPPTDKDTLRLFLGLAEYYARFVGGYAQVVEPLRLLFKKGQKFTWTHDLDIAFIKVKDLIISAQALHAFRDDCLSTITVDASMNGLGAVLSQRVNGREQSVAFATRSLKTFERNYSTIEREALACVWAVQKFKIYIWGRKFIILSDHKPLTYIFCKTPKNSMSTRLTRLISKLKEYNFEIKHIQGGKNVQADCLSRMLMEKDEENVREEDESVAVLDAIESCNSVISEAEWKAASVKDNILPKVIQYTSSKWPEVRNLSGELRNLSLVADEISVKDGLVLCGDKYIPPSELRKSLIKIAHEGHLGVSKTCMNIKQRYWWPALDAQVRSMVDNCEECLVSDKHWKLPKVPLHPSDFPEKPWEKVGLDFSGPYSVLN